MFLIDDLLLAPVNGFKFILGQIQKLADQELNDDTVIKEQLLELEMRRELEEMSEEEFQEREAEIGVTYRLHDAGVGEKDIEFTAAIGYAFSRELSVGFDSNNSRMLADVSDEPYVRFQARVKF